MIQSANVKDVLITLQTHLLNFANPQKESGNLYLTNMAYPRKMVPHISQYSNQLMLIK